MRTLVAVMMVLVALAGCSDDAPATDDPPAPSVDIDDPGMEDERSTDPEMPGVFVWGNLVECGDGAHCYDVYARNEGTRTYYYSGCIPPWQYGIEDEDGEVVTTHRESQGIPACAFEDPVDPQPLPPGEYIGRRICWPEATGNGQHVEPGTYRWVAAVTLYKNDEDPYEPVQIPTETTVEVTEGPQPSCP